MNKLKKPKVTYKFFDGCNGTPALPYIYYAQHELHKAGHGIEALNFSHDSKAFVAFDGEVPVGIILFDDYRWRNTTFVLLGFVTEAYRRQGVYTELWNKLVARSQEEKMPIIEGGTHITNVAMQRVMEAQGRVATHLTYTFKVPEVSAKRKASK